MGALSKPEIAFVVIGDPVGKQRPRVIGRRAITPKETRDYENLVAFSALAELAELSNEDRKKWPTKEQVYLDMWMFHSKKRGRRPDPDNVIKSILDGLTGVLWRDDVNVLPRVQAVQINHERSGIKIAISFTGYKLWQ